ncbi:MAG: PAS domain S-box protein [Leptolyngbyaceae cyanobacterium SM2_3_12]|nr:PAS domain S-box protein [Leptolyngbyaceae cyanobacterium SM2_3_12]
MTNISVDITARKQMETHLRESEAELRGLFESMDDVVLVLDRQGRYIKVVSSKSDHLLYRPADELVGCSVQDFLTTEQVAAFLGCIQRALDTHTTQDIEYSLPIDGVERWFSAKCSSIGPDQVIWVARDITDYRHTQQALKESEARFKAIFDHAAVGICQFTMAGHMVIANQQFCDFIGYTEAELQQITYADYSHPDDLRIDDALMEQLVNGEIPHFTMEKRYIHRSGELRWASLTVSLIYGTDGSPRYDIAVIEDIRDRKRQEYLIEGQRQALQALAQGNPYPRS